MDRLLEVMNESIDSTSTRRFEISKKNQINSIKNDMDDLVQSKICIKTELQEEESNFSMNAGTSNEMCLNYDAHIGTIVKIDSEDLLDEKVQDFDVGNEIKVAGKVREENFSYDSKDKIKNKMKQFNQEEKYNLASDTEPGSAENEKSKNKNQLLIKKEKIHKKKIFTCHLCDRICSKRNELEIHLRIHTGERPFTCHICKKSFNRKDILGMHVLSHTDERPYACDVCGKVFKYQTVLYKHKMIHNEVKPYSCIECNKSFAQKINLDNHKRVHSNDKPFTCDICEKAFAVKAYLTQHRRLHTGEKPYSCSICNKSFSHRAGLKYHMKTCKK